MPLVEVYSTVEPRFKDPRLIQRVVFVLTTSSYILNSLTLSRLFGLYHGAVVFSFLRSPISFAEIWVR